MCPRCQVQITGAFAGDVADFLNDRADNRQIQVPVGIEVASDDRSLEGRVSDGLQERAMQKEPARAISEIGWARQLAERIATNRLRYDGDNTRPQIDTKSA